MACPPGLNTPVSLGKIANIPPTSPPLTLWPGKHNTDFTKFFPNQYKTFGDWAIYSLALQLREPFFNCANCKSEWIIPLSLHSDFAMAPADPLLLAWVAANRIVASGKVMNPEQKISVYNAMKGITISALALLKWKMK